MFARDPLLGYPAYDACKWPYHDRHTVNICSTNGEH